VFTSLMRPHAVHMMVGLIGVLVKQTLDCRGVGVRH
jgi:hypothetical protein